MRVPTLLLLLCTAVGVLAAARPSVPDAATADHGEEAVDIVIRDFAFRPQVVHVARGGTVTWTHDDAPSHNITARDRSFSTTLGNGETFTVDVGDEDRFIDYFCGIHASMTGRIVVGEGPPPSVAPVVRVPEDERDLERAVLLASADTVIDVAPGQYLLGEPLAPTAPRVTVRGRGERPGDVRITPGLSQVSPAVRVEAAGFTLSNVRLVSFVDTVVDVGPVDGFTMRDVEVIARDGGRRDGRQAEVGIHLRGANGVAIVDTTVADATVAGLQVDACDACAVALTRTAWRDNAIGIAAADGVAVVARDLDVRGGDVGVRVQARVRPASLLLERATVASGRAGIWLTGVRASQLRSLRLSGHATYGLAIEGAAADDVTVRGVEGDANAVDVGWDGIGRDTCFDLEDATTDPPTLSTTAACGAQHPVSAYWPVVTARLVTS